MHLQLNLFPPRPRHRFQFTNCRNVDSRHSSYQSVTLRQIKLGQLERFHSHDAEYHDLSLKLIEGSAETNSTKL